jgi:glycosyltransferase involved in cell wall biosynthesis
MIKVCFLHHGLGYGGATKSLILLQESIKNHCEIYTYSLPSHRHPEIKEFFVNSTFVKEIILPTIYSYSAATSKIREIKNIKIKKLDKLLYEIGQLDIDVLHINSTLFSHILKPLKESFPKLKIVVHLREALPFGFDHPVDSFIIENTLKYSDKIIAITNNEARFFVGSDKLVILPNPHFFLETEKYLSLPNDDDKIVVGMISNFLPYKGHLTFIDSADRVIKNLGLNNDKIQFKIIGYPKKQFDFKVYLKKILNIGYKHKFDKKINNPAVKDYFKVIPFTFDVYDELSQFDIYIRPDYTGQPWGRDIIEAMALKKPVIATGTSEFYVENEVTGYLVQPKNPVELGEKIIELISDPHRRLSMGVAGYTKIKSMCDLEEYGKKVVMIYRNLIF